MHEFFRDMVSASHKLYMKSLVSNHDGNITFKLNPGQTEALYLATPTSFSKGDIQEEDLVVVNSVGKVVEGRWKVFSEISLHLEIYKVRPDICCVVHAHPVTASGLALAGYEIGIPPIPEAVVSLGRGVFNASGSKEFSQVLKESDAFLIPGNGAWTVGQNIFQTYYRMELVEHVAKQIHNALLVGAKKEQLSLSEDLVQTLLAKRPRPAAPIAADISDIVREETKNLFSQS